MTINITTKFWRIGAAIVVMVCCAASVLAQELVPQEVARILKRHGVPQSQTGLFIAWADGRPIAHLNGDYPFNPASAIKLATSMVALDQLGPGHVWQTKFLTAAPVVNGSLRGDLYFKGNGDPYLTNDRLLHLVASLARRGIVSVAGDVVIDDSLFLVNGHDPASFDGAGTKPYNAAPGASVVNFGATKVIIHVSDGKVHAFLEPPSSTFEFKNQLKLRKAKCTGSWRRKIKERLSRAEDGTARLVLSGTYASGCREKNFHLLGQSDPVAHVAGAVRGMFEELGGSIQGQWRKEKTPRNAKTVVALDSDPLAVAIRGMNKFSNNFMARNLFLSLGYDKTSRTHSIEKARQAMVAWFADHGINVENLFIDNGSGLSRSTRITPQQFGEAIVAFNKTSLRHELIASLAVLGRDGTARNWNRKKGSAGNAHIKTGTLANARATVGLVHNPAADIIFVMMVETRGTAAARRAIQDMLDWAYRLPTPDAA